jgi:hypothetical protein
MAASVFNRQYQVHPLIMLTGAAVAHMVVQELEPVVQAPAVLVEIVPVVLPHQMELLILVAVVAVAGSLIMQVVQVVLE